MAVKTYKCINCGSNINFDPTSGAFKCLSCESVFTKEEMDNFYDNLNDSVEDVKIELETNGKDFNTEENDLQSFNCSNCGGEIIAQGETVATFCPYCKSPSILKTKLQGEFRPNYILPFKFTEADAKEKYKKWISKKVYTPRVFKEKGTVDEIKGLYAPFWLYNMDIEGGFVGTGRKVHSWRSGDYVYTKTDYYRIRRYGKTHYDKLPHDASKNLDDVMVTHIEPYQYTDMLDFAMPYMSGFFAERYDLNAEECLNPVVMTANQYFEDRLKDTISGYSSFSILGRNYNYSGVKAAYAMLPLYYLANFHENKKREFFLNGQTGKIYGNPPISVSLVILRFVVSFIIAYIITLVGGVLIEKF